MKKILVLVLLVFSITLFSQDNFQEKVISPLTKDKLLFEKVYIHTNKEEYFYDDTIWFKAYVVNQDNQPSKKTTLLYVNLLDEKGDLIISKNVLIKNGFGLNQIDLPASIKNKLFYVQAYTNYMRNFKEHFFLKKINLTNFKEKLDFKEKPNYDIQLFPEGGNMLVGIKNNLSIKVLNNGRRVSYKGEIIDSKNRVISEFKEKDFGISKTFFYYKKGEKYSLKVTSKDTLIIKEIPKSQKEGVNFYIENNKDSLKVVFNSRLGNTNINDDYFVLLHKKNQIINYFELPIRKKTEIQLDKKMFLKGVNTITLFKNTTPISKRDFFIEKQDVYKKIKLEKITKLKDSVIYGLSIRDSKNQPIYVNVSLSVLLDNYSKFKSKININNSFDLLPYINGCSNNYVLNNSKKENIDLLLSTNINKYESLDDMILDLNPTYKYNFELGFNLKGTISPILTNELALISSKDKLINKIFLNKNKTKTFDFKKLLVYKGDSVKISFLKKNKAILPKNLKIDTTSTFTYPKKKCFYSEINNQITKEYFFINPDNIVLDEVEVKGKKRSKYYKEQKRFEKKYKSLVWDIGHYKLTKIDEYYKDKKTGLMKYLYEKEGVILRNWRLTYYYLTAGTRGVVLYIDGERVTSDKLAVISLDMNDIQDVGVRKGKDFKIIQVFTTKDYKKNIENLTKKIVIKKGYDRERKYFSFKQGSTSSRTVSELDWKPNLVYNESTKMYEFKVSKEIDFKNNNIVFYVQGVSEKGELINEVIQK